MTLPGGASLLSQTQRITSTPFPAAGGCCAHCNCFGPIELSSGVLSTKTLKEAVQRSFISLTTLSVIVTSATLLSSRVEAAALPGRGLSAAGDSLSLIETAQVYVYGGRRYCWYDDGWNGEGWYWCGYQFRRGFGYGGGLGFRGWRGGGEFRRGGEFRGGGEFRRGEGRGDFRRGGGGEFRRGGGSGEGRGGGG